MNGIICGYCDQEAVSLKDRYWYIAKKKYPLYVHNSCGVKLVSHGENIWTYHRLGKDKTAHADYLESLIEDVHYEQTKLSIWLYLS